MQSLQVWRRPAPLQSRCRCQSLRALNAVNASHSDKSGHPQQMVSVSFKVEYKCAYGQSLALVGSAAQMGNWTPKRGQRMHWSRGDVWTCDIMLPAGSAVECKYVILDEQGREQRWQEGSNMVVKIPATTQGLPVQRYDVGVSWCKTYTTFRAQPRADAAAAEATPAAPAAPGQVPTAEAVGALSAAVAVPPILAWASAKGGGHVAEQRSSPAQATAGGAKTLDRQHQHQRAVAAAAAALTDAVGPAAPAAAAPLQQPHRASDLLTATARLPGAEAAAAEAGGGKAATLMQAAANVVRDREATAGEIPSAAGAVGAAPSPAQPALAAASIQMSPGAGEDEPKMSIVLPSRSSSPPVKISLSSSFSRLMEMPTAPAARPAVAAAAAAASPAADRSASSAAAAAAPAAAIQSHPIDTASPAAPQVAPLPTAGSASASGSSSATATAGATKPGRAGLRKSRSPRRSRRAAAPVQPMWGMEYDVYAAAYGIPYMHTPFDLDAYAMYDQPSQEPAASSPSSPLLSSTLGSATHGSVSVGTDPLEHAVQAAHNITSPAVLPGSTVLSTELLGATAASTALALSGAVAVAPSPIPVPLPAAHVQSNTAAAAAAAPAAAVSATAVAPAAIANAPAAASATTVAAAAAVGAVAATTLPPPPQQRQQQDDYRQVSRSSTSVTDWAGRTLMELGSGRTLLDDDSDEDEAADNDESVVAQAMAVPVAPGEMAALLTQLGTALGRSVRLRYDGVDATAQDLLELDRKIALAASKLYRQRDSLLTGWLRKETRRQLAGAAAAAAPQGRAPLQTLNNTVTPL